MASRIAVRALSLIGVLIVLSLAVFVIQRSLPSDPVRAIYGRNATAKTIAAKRAELGYDRPLIEQYGTFADRLLHGDLGTSLRSRRPVTDDIGDFLPATLELAVVSALMAAALGLFIGIVGARSGLASGTVRGVSIAFSAAPTFLLGIVGILVLYRGLGWLPPGQRSSHPSSSSPTGFLLVDSLLHGDLAQFGDAARHIVMPAIALALGPAVAIGRTLRGSLREVLRNEYIRTAEAKGLSPFAVVRRHGLRNALNPALAIGGLQLGLLLSGAVIVEVVFSWPGIGLYLSQGIAVSDFPAVMGVVLVLGLGYVLVNAAVDVAQLVIDPRLRASS